MEKWIDLAIAAAPSIIGMFGSKKRSSGDEVPGMSQYIQQSLQGQLNAQTYANAAVDPNSAWFRNLSALFREAEEAEAIRGIRSGRLNEQKLRARGVIQGFVADPERRDERSDPTRAFRQAMLNSRAAAQNSLLAASGQSARTMGDPNQAFKLLSQYGDAEAKRRGQQTDALGTLLGIFGNFGKDQGWFGGGTGGGYGYGQSANLGGLAW